MNAMNLSLYLKKFNPTNCCDVFLFPKDPSVIIVNDRRIERNTVSPDVSPTESSELDELDENLTTKQGIK